MPATVGAMLVALLLSGCSSSESSKSSRGQGTGQPDKSGEPGDQSERDGAPKSPSWSEVAPIFAERAKQSGLDFSHQSGAEGQYYFPEIMGPGGALLDYDNDGDLDVFLVQGNRLQPGKNGPKTDGKYRDRLFRNDLIVDGSGDAAGKATLRFTDVTEEAELVSTGYGMGAVAGDYDGDGFVDLYVLEFGENRLLRNDGDGTFSDVTARAGVKDQRWSVSGSFLDYDRDGDLDLFVVNYVDFTLANNKECVRQVRDYCNPQSFQPVPDRLFRNRGDGTFEDVTGEAGIGGAYGSGLGVATADVDGDGWVDIYTANDGNANQLWMNRRVGQKTGAKDIRYEDNALPAGCALNLMGAAEAGMGVDLADFDDDGDEDIFITHLKGETNTLYVNDGTGNFEDRTVANRLEAQSRPYTGFGAGWLDFDNDGRLDLASVNGDVAIIEDQLAAGSKHPYVQDNQLFWNSGRGFHEVSRHAGFGEPAVSRGAMFGDVDNDGDTDLIVANNSGPARLYLNRIGNRNHWLGLELRAATRTSVAARVAVSVAGQTLWRRSRVDGSYASASDARVLFGLGRAEAIELLLVSWPDGTIEAWDQLDIDRYTTIERGSGLPIDADAVKRTLATANKRGASRAFAAKAAPASGQNSGQATSQGSDEPGAASLSLPDLGQIEAPVRQAIETQWKAARALTDDAGAKASDRARAYGTLGMLLHVNKFSEAAAAAYAETARHAPGEFRWQYYRGKVLRDLGHLDRSAEVLRAAQKLDPDYVALAIALGQHAQERNQLEAARRHFRKAVKLDPRCAPGWVGLGHVNSIAKKYRKAVEYFEKALQLAPEATSIHYPLALAYRNLGDAKAAERHLQRRGTGRPPLKDPLMAAVQEMGTGARALRAKGEKAAQAGRLPEARRHFAEAVELAPDDAGLLLNLGEIDRLLGDRAAAMKSFQKIVDMAGGSAPAGTRANAHQYLGELYGEARQDDKAIEHLRAALELDSQRLAASFHLADALRRSRQFVKAAEIYESVIQRAPQDPASRTGRLLSLIAAGKYKEAVAAAEADVKAMPRGPAFKHILARLLATVPIDDARDGVRAQKLAVSLGTATDHDLAATFAMIDAEVGKFEGAVTWQKKAIALAEKAKPPAAEMAELRANLARYEKKQPCRRPWPDKAAIFVQRTFRPGAR